MSKWVDEAKTKYQIPFTNDLACFIIIYAGINNSSAEADGDREVAGAISCLAENQRFSIMAAGYFG